MGELTNCNYCTLRGIRARAKTDGQAVTLRHNSVYVHPPDVKIHALSNKKREGYFVAWFMELTDHCAC